MGILGQANISFVPDIVLGQQNCLFSVSKGRQHTAAWCCTVEGWVHFAGISCCGLWELSRRIGGIAEFPEKWVYVYIGAGAIDTHAWQAENNSWEFSQIRPRSSCEDERTDMLLFRWEKLKGMSVSGQDFCLCERPRLDWVALQKLAGRKLSWVSENKSSANVRVRDEHIRFGLKTNLKMKEPGLKEDFVRDLWADSSGMQDPLICERLGAGDRLNESRLQKSPATAGDHESHVWAGYSTHLHAYGLARLGFAPVTTAACRIQSWSRMG